MSWPGGMLQPLTFPCSLALLVSTILFRTGGVLPHVNSSIHKFSRYPQEIATFAVFLPIFLAVDLTFYLNLISVELGELRILRQRLWSSDPGHLSSHFALSCYVFFVSLAIWRLLFSLRPLVHVLRSCPAFGVPCSFTMSPSLERGWVTTTARAHQANFLTFFFHRFVLSIKKGNCKYFVLTKRTF